MSKDGGSSLKQIDICSKLSPRLKSHWDLKIGGVKRFSRLLRFFQHACSWQICGSTPLAWVRFLRQVTFFGNVFIMTLSSKGLGCISFKDVLWVRIPTELPFSKMPRQQRWSMQRTENPWMPDRYGLLAPIIVRWSSGLRRLFAKQIV